MQWLLDFLNFDVFVSPGILKALYFIGALVLPLLGWFVLQKARSRYPGVEAFFSAANSTTGTRFRFLRWLFFAFAIICAETLWRIIFEYLVAYLQMRDALMKLLQYNVRF
ncbi:MAG: DUF4282 domain-containing protein [Thermovirgaceae bacterium]|nr:DUF4282 domain-containing protein [Thermovirgaceae bacterium]